MNSDLASRTADSSGLRKLRSLLAAFTLVWLAVLIAACGGPATSDATAGLTRVPDTPTIFRIVITRTPSPAPTFEPTATLPYDIGGMTGTWAVDLRFALLDNSVFSRVQYIGAAALNVDERGYLSGALEFYATVVPSASQTGCTTSVTDSVPITARIEGALRPGDGDNVLGDITLVPDDPLAVTSLWLFCPDFSEPYEAAELLFWPALRAANMLEFALPFQPGARFTSSADLTGPSGGGLHGLLQSEIRLTR